MKVRGRLLFILVALLAVPSARAQHGGLKLGWKMVTSRVPPGYLAGGTDFSGEDHKLIVPMPRLDGTNEASVQFDVRPWLAKEAGVELPEGAVGIYDRSTSLLVLIAPGETIEKLDPLLTVQFCGMGATQVRITATLVEYSIDQPAKARNLPYQRLRSVAGKTWREVEEIAVTTKSGQRAVGRQREGDTPRDPLPPQDSPDWQPPLAAGEAGAALEVEPVVGPDAETIDLDLAWHRRLGQAEKARQIESVTSLHVKDGIPVIVGRWPVNAAPASGLMRSYALVIRADLMTAEGVPVREAFVAAARKLREQAKMSAPR